MQVLFNPNAKISSISTNDFVVNFDDKFGFFIGDEEVLLNETANGFVGSLDNVDFSLKFDTLKTHLKISFEIINNGSQDVYKDIGLHTGIDSYMIDYPQWHTPFFPTLLRCEKTHFWGYYMNTAENALAVASDSAAASYDIKYNQLTSEDNGHRILGTDILFFKNAKLPERHPQNLKVLKAGESYKNTIYFIPVKNKKDIAQSISKIADVPVIQSQKYTYEKNETLEYRIYNNSEYITEITLPDGSISKDKNPVLVNFGIYKLKAISSNGKISEALYCCRKDWDFYLYSAAAEAMAKPQKATTHVESFYGLFSCFLSMKYFNNPEIDEKAYECFHEIMPHIFDLEECKPIVIPQRIQNTALFISLLVDIYEADKLKNIKYLYIASAFGDWMMTNQSDDGVYRNKNVHYTCVIYIAKAMLELALAEKNCDSAEIREKYKIHYNSVKKAVDELVLHKDNIDTEGEITLEDGMISCSALQIGMFALTLDNDKRVEYIEAAEYMMRIHSCLEQQLIPDCRMNGASLRYWESQYDVMIRSNMLSSPHGWTGWTAYAHYYLYLLTGKKEYLLALMNTLGSAAQLMSFDGKLCWGFCAQPFVLGRTLVPDIDKPVLDGYKFVDTKEKAYRAKYEIREFGEEYIDMISGWYRTGEQKVTGGYAFCPLIFEDHYINVDNQGGCCDNDVHEIFKCIEECVLRKSYIYENEDGTFLTYGCTVIKFYDRLEITVNDNSKEVIYNFKNSYKNNISGENELFGFGTLIL